MAPIRKTVDALMEVLDIENQASIDQQVKLNISGQNHTTTIATLLKYPKTKLGKLADSLTEDDAQKIHFFDADQDVFKEIMRYYRHAELHKPPGITRKMFIKELQLWGIEEHEIALCCRLKSQEEMDPEREEIDSKVKMEKQFEWFEKRIEPKNRNKLTMQEKIWYSITEPSGPFTRYTKLSFIYFFTLILVIIFHSISLGLYSVQFILDQATGTNMTYLEIIDNQNIEPCYFTDRWIDQPPDITTNALNTIVIYYVLDNMLRFAFCPDKKRFFSVTSSIDLAACVYEFFAVAAVQTMQHRPDHRPTSFAACKTFIMITNIRYVVGQLRVCKLFMISTTISSVRVIWLALYASLKEIGLLFVSLGIATLFFGPLIFYTESLLGHVFGHTDMNIINIPQGYWWSVVTMTTVGYGDFYPTNVFSYITSTFIMGIGLMVTALPIAIIGGNFAIYHEYNEEREKKRAAEKTELELKSEQDLNNMTVKILMKQTTKRFNNIGK